jgi:outer membrane protein
MRLRSVAFVLAVTSGFIASAGAQERLTVERAVEMALKSNFRLRAVEKRAAAGHDQALGTGARMLPSVHLSEEFQRWDCAAAFSFANFAAGAVCLDQLKPTTPVKLDFSSFTPAQQAALAPVAGLVGSFANAPPIVARQQNTNSFVAAVDQPLLGLLHTGFDFAAQRASAQASDEGVKVSMASTAQLVRNGFLQYFEARALADIASASMKELDDQVQVAQARLKAGVITNADLLRVVVAQANAQQQRIAAETQAAIVKTQLLDAIGFEGGANVDLVEPSSLLAQTQAPLPNDGDAREQAVTKRPEARQAQLAEKSAHATKKARYLSLLPEVDAEGAYVRTDGQLFAPANQWFIGVKATWAIWEWGASFFQARAAGQLAEAAALEQENERRTIGVEVDNALAQTRAAGVSVDVAQKTIASAEEAYRVMQALVNAGTATTTDLLDAQSALTTARLNLTRARYEQAMQRVALTRAMGM